MRIATEPDEEERERWRWAGDADPLERVRAVLRDYDDEALLREFLTPKVCERCRLYAFERTAKHPHRIRVSSRESETIRELLVRQHSTFGIPAIEIVDADFRGRGELLLEHRHDGIGLDPEYARGTLTEIATLWGKACTVRTIKDHDTQRPLWFTGHPDGHTDRHDQEPSPA
jgi:stage V sporulation protein R